MVTVAMARAMGLDFSRRSIEGRLSQGHNKVFTAGQARVNSEQYVIKCVGGQYSYLFNAHVAVLSLLNLQNHFSTLFIT